jgi:hypothetical protein
MPTIQPTMRDAADPRFRGAVTTILLIMIVIMIVRDIFARRRARRDISPIVR